MSNRLTDRNLAIWEASRSGRSIRDIAREFGISPARTQTIVERYRSEVSPPARPQVVRTVERSILVAIARTSAMAHDISLLERELMELRALIDGLYGRTTEELGEPL